MEKETVLDFAEFLKDMGLWYWNTALVSMLETHFNKNYYNYEIDTMCRLVKLIGYNYNRSDDMFTLIEDSMKIRLVHLIQ